jgi:hypothetical protein
VGTLNLLHRADWYRPDHIELATVFAQLALPAVMALSLPPESSL